MYKSISSKQMNASLRKEGQEGAEESLWNAIRMRKTCICVAHKHLKRSTIDINGYLFISYFHHIVRVCINVSDPEFHSQIFYDFIFIADLVESI